MTLSSPLISPPKLSDIPKIIPVQDESTSKPPALKKSHARKQPPGHIPRPRNAFILFRCDFVHKKKVPESVESDHRNISRIVGRVWREMTDEAKRPWLDEAEREKERHLRAYPGYKYSPASSGSVAGAAGTGAVGARKRKAGPGRQRDMNDGKRSPMHATVPKRRSSSCPPPNSIPVSLPADDPEYLPQYSLPLVSQDDSGRRGSRITMYHSAAAYTPQPSENSTFTIYGEAFTFPESYGDRGPPLVSNAFGIIAPPTGYRSWEDTYDPYPLGNNAEQNDYHYNYLGDDIGLVDNYDIQASSPDPVSKTPPIKTESPPSLQFSNPFTFFTSSSESPTSSNSNSSEYISPLDLPDYLVSSSELPAWQPIPFDDYSEYIVDPTVDFAPKHEFLPPSPLSAHDRDMPPVPLSELEIGNIFPRLSIDDLITSAAAPSSSSREGY